MAHVLPYGSNAREQYSMTAAFDNNTISKSKMISRRQERGNETYCTYVEEADDAANKDSTLI
jgi:hypothetical protein